MDPYEFNDHTVHFKRKNKRKSRARVEDAVCIIQTADNDLPCPRISLNIVLERHMAYQRVKFPFLISSQIKGLALKALGLPNCMGDFPRMPGKAKPAWLQHPKLEVNKLVMFNYPKLLRSLVSRLSKKERHDLGISTSQEDEDSEVHTYDWSRDEESSDFSPGKQVMVNATTGLSVTKETIRFSILEQQDSKEEEKNQQSENKLAVRKSGLVIDSPVLVKYGSDSSSRIRAHNTEYIKQASVISGILEIDSDTDESVNRINTNNSMSEDHEEGGIFETPKLHTAKKKTDLFQLQAKKVNEVFEKSTPTRKYKPLSQPKATTDSLHNRLKRKDKKTGTKVPSSPVSDSDNYSVGLFVTPKKLDRQQFETNETESTYKPASHVQCDDKQACISPPSSSEALTCIGKNLSPRENWVADAENEVRETTFETPNFHPKQKAKYAKNKKFNESPGVDVILQAENLSGKRAGSQQQKQVVNKNENSLKININPEFHEKVNIITKKQKNKCTRKQQAVKANTAVKSDVKNRVSLSLKRGVSTKNTHNANSAVGAGNSANKNGEKLAEVTKDSFQQRTCDNCEHPAASKPQDGNLELPVAMYSGEREVDMQELVEAKCKVSVSVSMSEVDELSSDEEHQVQPKSKVSDNVVSEVDELSSDEEQKVQPRSKVSDNVVSEVDELSSDEEQKVQPRSKVSDSAMSEVDELSSDEEQQVQPRSKVSDNVVMSEVNELSSDEKQQVQPRSKVSENVVMSEVDELSSDEEQQVQPRSKVSDSVMSKVNELTSDEEQQVQPRSKVSDSVMSEVNELTSDKEQQVQRRNKVSKSATILYLQTAGDIEKKSSKVAFNSEYESLEPGDEVKPQEKRGKNKKQSPETLEINVSSQCELETFAPAKNPVNFRTPETLNFNSDQDYDVLTEKTDDSDPDLDVEASHCTIPYVERKTRNAIKSKKSPETLEIDLNAENDSDELPETPESDSEIESYTAQRTTPYAGRKLGNTNALEINLGIINESETEKQNSTMIHHKSSETANLASGDILGVSCVEKRTRRKVSESIPIYTSPLTPVLHQSVVEKPRACSFSGTPRIKLLEPNLKKRKASRGRSISEDSDTLYHLSQKETMNSESDSEKKNRKEHKKLKRKTSEGISSAESSFNFNLDTTSELSFDNENAAAENRAKSHQKKQSLSRGQKTRNLQCETPSSEVTSPQAVQAEDEGFTPTFVRADHKKNALKENSTAEKCQPPRSDVSDTFLSEVGNNFRRFNPTPPPKKKKKDTEYIQSSDESTSDRYMATTPFSEASYKSPDESDFSNEQVPTQPPKKKKMKRNISDIESELSANTSKSDFVTPPPKKKKKTYVTTPVSVKSGISEESVEPKNKFKNFVPTPLKKANVPISSDEEEGYESCDEVRDAESFHTPIPGRKGLKMVAQDSDQESSVVSQGDSSISTIFTRNDAEESDGTGERESLFSKTMEVPRKGVAPSEDTESFVVHRYGTRQSVTSDRVPLNLPNINSATKVSRYLSGLSSQDSYFPSSPGQQQETSDLESGVENQPAVYAVSECSTTRSYLVRLFDDDPASSSLQASARAPLQMRATHSATENLVMPPPVKSGKRGRGRPRKYQAK